MKMFYKQVILLKTVLLIGCIAVESGENPTITSPSMIPSEVMVTDSPTLSPTPTITTTPSPTASLTPTRIPAGAFPYPENDYFFSEDSECQLPCWQELRVGESNLADYHRIVREKFDFNDENIGLEEPLKEIFSLPDTGLHAAGYGSETTDSMMVVTAVTNENSNVLRALGFTLYDPFDDSDFNHHEMQTILRIMGEPTSIYVEFLKTAPADGFGRVLIIYEEGVSFFLVHNISDSQFCLNQPAISETIFITEPFSPDLTGLNELQEAILEKAFRSNYLPSESVFRMSPAQITQLAMTEENTCFQSK